MEDGTWQVLKKASVAAVSERTHDWRQDGTVVRGQSVWRSISHEGC